MYKYCDKYEFVNQERYILICVILHACLLSEGVPTTLLAIFLWISNTVSQVPDHCKCNKNLTESHNSRFWKCWKYSPLCSHQILNCAVENIFDWFLLWWHKKILLYCKFQRMSIGKHYCIGKHCFWLPLTGRQIVHGRMFYVETYKCAERNDGCYS